MNGAEESEFKVFVTNQFGAKQLWDKEGFIGEFRNSNNNVIVADDGIKRRDSRTPELWYMTLSDPELINRAMKYPGFGKMFNVTDKEPVWNTLKNLKTLSDPNAASAVASQTKAIEADMEAKVKAGVESGKEDLKNIYKEKSRRYAYLFSQVAKKGGAIMKDADPVLVNEFKELQEFLGIDEMPEEEEEPVTQ